MTTGHICAYCLCPLSPRVGWVEIPSEHWGRVVPICRSCWDSTDQPRIIAALGIATKEKTA